MMKKTVKIANRVLTLPKAFTVSILLLSSYPFALNRGLCDPLEDILPQVNEKARSSEEKLNADHWFVGASNYKRLFANPSAAEKYIREWLGDLITSEFSQDNSSAELSFQFAKVDSNFHNINNPKININFKVLAPHPKYLDLVRNRLIRDFADLRPPNLAVSEILKDKIQGRDCYKYRHKDGSCSIFFEMPHGVAINIKSNQCESYQSLERFANLLELNRFAAKLEN